MSVVESIRSIRTRLSKAVASVSSDISGLRAQINARRADLKRLDSAPPPRTDISARIRDMVERRGNGFMRSDGRFIVDSLGNPRKGPRVPWSEKDGDVIPFNALCAADPDFACALLMKLVDRASFEEGIPLAQRPAAIQKLESELAELEATEERLVDEANASGLEIAHRKDVVDRRANEARRAELEAEKLADRAQRQEGVDWAHLSAMERARPKRRVGISQYLGR